MKQRFNPAAYAVSNIATPSIVTPQIPPPLPARAYGLSEKAGEANDADVDAAIKATIEPLQVGSRVYCGLYGGSTGIVYEINGEQHPENVRRLGGGAVVTGGSAHFKIVFLGERSHLSSIPEAIIHGGGQWEILEGIATAEEIKTARAENEARQRVAKVAQQAKEAALARERAELPAKYPQLQTVSREGKHKSTHVLGATNIRIQLNCAFPGTKFSVRSESGRINVGWDAGPTYDSVVAITSKYEEGHFDGQDDSYHFNAENVWPSVFGGAHYVFARRNIPMALRQQVNEVMFTLYSDRDMAEREASELLARTTIPNRATFKGIRQRPEGGDYFIEWNEPVRPGRVPPLGSGIESRLRLVEAVHTKKKIPIWVANLTVRVERPEFESLRNQAKALGGYYSMYRGEGAIPGFIFTTAESASQFMQQSGGMTTPSAANESSVTLATAPDATAPEMTHCLEAAGRSSEAIDIEASVMPDLEAEAEAEAELQAPAETLPPPDVVPSWRHRFGSR